MKSIEESIKEYFEDFNDFTIPIEVLRKQEEWIISNFFLTNGLKVDKITRSRLNDGYIIYHELGLFITNNERWDSLPTDYDSRLLERIVLEALQRAGKEAKLKISVFDFINKKGE